MRTIVKALTAVAAFGATVFTAEATDYPEMRLKYGTVLPQGNSISDMDEYFNKAITEKSGGKIKVDNYWNRALGKDEEMLPLIAAGAVDIVMLQTSVYSETPFLGFMNSLPMVFSSSKDVLEVSNILYSTSERHQQELKEIDARVIMVRQHPNYYLLCTSPIRAMADFRGKKIRSYGAYVPLMWEAVGAIPVNVASTEIYASLDKGVIDCAYWAFPFMVGYKLDEVAKYVIDFSFGTIELAPVVIPNLIWNKWPAEVQAIVTEAAAEAQAWGTAHIDSDGDKSRQLLLSRGAILVPFEEADALTAAVPDMLDIWLQKQEAAGRGADAQKVVELTRKALAD